MAAPPPPLQVSVRLFHAGQRLNKDFFRDDESSGKRRRGSKNDNDEELLDGKGLLQLAAKGNLTAQECAVVSALMHKQDFIAVSVAIEAAGESLDLRALCNQIGRRTVQPSGVIRAIPTDADGVSRIPPAHQDMGIAFEMQFKSIEDLRHGVSLFRQANLENQEQRKTWYSRISGCCHRYISSGDFWRRYDVFKYDFDQVPRLHLAFHPGLVTYSLLASFPCRLRGDSMYQRFALVSPFVSPIVESVPPDAPSPQCNCNTSSSSSSSYSTRTVGTPAAAAAAPPTPALSPSTATALRLPKSSVMIATTRTPLDDALFFSPLPEVYHINPALLSLPNSPLPAVVPAQHVEDLVNLPPDAFLLPSAPDIVLLGKSLMSHSFFGEDITSDTV